MTFREFIGREHGKRFPKILDDELPDHFDEWLSGLDRGELYELQELFRKLNEE